MSVPATAPSLDLLDRLMAADEVWAHSAEEGRAVAEHILASQAAIVLLYGPARAASTAFMQRWVIPALSQWKRVSYVAAGEPISFDDGPDAGTGIRIFAGFEHHLAEGGSPTETMRRLAAATATSGTGKLVLVLQEDYLSRLFMAREVVPTILDDVFAIPTMPADKFVEALERTAATLGVTIDDGFVAALTRDLDADPDAGDAGARAGRDSRVRALSHDRRHLAPPHARGLRRPRRSRRHPRRPHRLPARGPAGGRLGRHRLGRPAGGGAHRHRRADRPSSTSPTASTSPSTPRWRWRHGSRPIAASCAPTTKADTTSCRRCCRAASSTTPAAWPRRSSTRTRSCARRHASTSSSTRCRPSRPSAASTPSAAPSSSPTTRHG